MKQKILASNVKESLAVLQLMGRRKWLYLLSSLGDSASQASLPIIAAFVYIESFNGAVSRDTSLILQSAIVFAASVAAVAVLAAICKFVAIYTVKAAVRELRGTMYDKVLSLPLSRHEKTHSGDFLSRMTADVQAVEDLYLNQFKSFIYFVSYSAGSIVTMLVLEWRIAILLIALAVISSFFVTRFAGSLRTLSDGLQQAKSDMTQRTIDLLSGLRVIKLYQAEEVVLARSREVNDKLAEAQKSIGGKLAIMDATSYFLHIINYYGVILFGVFMVISGHMGIGIVIAFAQLQFNMSNAFLQLGQFVVKLQGGLAGAARVRHLLEMKEERLDAIMLPHEKQRTAAPVADIALAAQRNLADRVPGIEFQGVSFSYPASLPVLSKLSFTVSKGQVAAFVGASGGGKSTIIKLLLGFYEHQAGEILIAGKPLCSYGVPALRNMIAYVPQDAHLFEGTVLDNIRFGRPEATEHEVQEAAKAAIAHDFILSFPDGYDTLVGERGSRLSGGQKQRIAIARAFLMDALIVILDEATSSLDGESERLVHASMLRLMEDRTVILIAHRLAAIEKADIIYVVEKGKIAECGSHDDLLKAQGMYHGLLKRSGAPLAI